MTTISLISPGLTAMLGELEGLLYISVYDGIKSLPTSSRANEFPFRALEELPVLFFIS